MSISIRIPAGQTVKIAGDKIIVSGPKGTVERKFPIRNLNINVSGDTVQIAAMGKTAHHRMLEGTFNAHINNMLRGTQEPFVYKLKVTYVHFPMTVTIAGEKITVKNFLGAKRDKIAKIPAGVTVKLEGDIIAVSSPDIELAGKTVSRIEQTTRISNRDRRVFLDGIYLIERRGRPITLT